MGPAEEGKSSNGKGGQALRRPIETHLRHYYRLRDIPTVSIRRMSNSSINFAAVVALRLLLQSVCARSSATTSASRSVACVVRESKAAAGSTRRRVAPRAHIEGSAPGLAAARSRSQALARALR